MASNLLSKASSAVASCARRVSRATRRLLRSRRRRHHQDRRQLVPVHQRHEESPRDDDEGEKEGEGLWRRAILMGERCQPLDFPGVIHYDSFGRRLSAPPPPRGGGGKAALLCRSTYDVDEAAFVAPRKVKHV